MTRADLPAVVRLEHALFGDEAWSETMLASELDGAASGRHYLVAEDAGEAAPPRTPADAARWSGTPACSARAAARPTCSPWPWPRTGGASGSAPCCWTP